ncbi:MAG: hypothetical protein H6739_37100 [Alphaproteobacteria bacterium]|nr:hypothetical protein [Alphaproteobacteria bacterium]
MTIFLTTTLAVVECARTGGGRPFIKTCQTLHYIVDVVSNPPGDLDPQAVPQST